MSGIFKTRCSGLFLTNLSRTSIPQIQGKFKLTQPLIIATFYSSYEQTNIFLYACAATVIAAIIFSKGSPYRQPLYRNGGQNHKMLHRSKCCLFLCSSHNFAHRCFTLFLSDHVHLGGCCDCHRLLHVPLQVAGITSGQMGMQHLKT